MNRMLSFVLKSWKRQNLTFKYIKIKVKVILVFTIISFPLRIHQVPLDFIHLAFHCIRPLVTFKLFFLLKINK